MIEESLGILTDPAHILAEACFIMVEMVLISPLVAVLVRWHDKRHHPKG